MRTAIALMLGCAAGVGAQTARDATPADSAPLSVAVAEARGRAFAPLVPRQVLPAQFSDSSVVGSPDRRCVSVNGDALVRAGDFLIGPFTPGSGPWWFKKLWWVPASLAGELQVVAVHLAGAAPAQIFHQPQVAFPSINEQDNPFHPSRLVLHRGGPWMLIATSGSSWGCILVEVP